MKKRCFFKFLCNNVVAETTYPPDPAFPLTQNEFQETKNSVTGDGGGTPNLRESIKSVGALGSRISRDDVFQETPCEAKSTAENNKGESSLQMFCDSYCNKKELISNENHCLDCKWHLYVA